MLASRLLQQLNLPYIADIGISGWGAWISGYRVGDPGYREVGISGWGAWISGNRDIGLGSLDIGKAGNIIVSKIRYTVVGE